LLADSLQSHDNDPYRQQSRPGGITVVGLNRNLAAGAH
jgi:hypothetical protein